MVTTLLSGSGAGVYCESSVASIAWSLSWTVKMSSFSWLFIAFYYRFRWFTGDAHRVILKITYLIYYYFATCVKLLELNTVLDGLINFPPLCLIKLAQA